MKGVCISAGIKKYWFQGDNLILSSATAKRQETTRLENSQTPWKKNVTIPLQMFLTDKQRERDGSIFLLHLFTFRLIFKRKKGAPTHKEELSCDMRIMVALSLSLSVPCVYESLVAYCTSFLLSSYPWTLAVAAIAWGPTSTSFYLEFKINETSSFLMSTRGVLSLYSFDQLPVCTRLWNVFPNGFLSHLRTVRCVLIECSLVIVPRLAVLVKLDLNSSLFSDLH